jgi:hypothetical protein
MNDDFTHTVSITVSGNYAHGPKTHSSVIVSGDGGIDHMLDAFKAILVASGYSADTANRLGISEE